MVVRSFIMQTTGFIAGDTPAKPTLNTVTIDPGISNTLCLTDTFSAASGASDANTLRSLSVEVATPTLALDPGFLASQAPMGSPLPAWNGYKAWTYDPALIAATISAAAGQLFLSRLWVPAGTYSKIDYALGTAGSGLTSGQNWIGVIDGTTGSRLAQSADQTTAWASSGTKSTSFQAAFTQATAGWCYTAVLANGTTVPAFSRAASSGQWNIGLPAGQYRGGVAGTGQTTLPATTTLTSMAATNNVIWAGLS